jgi:hypothetical protein
MTTRLERWCRDAACRVSTAAGNSGRLLLAALREIFDEAAYARFLERTAQPSSRAAYAGFLRERARRTSGAYAAADFWCITSPGYRSAAPRSPLPMPCRPASS